MVRVTIDPLDPARADKWGYSDEAIRRVIPGLKPTPGAEGRMRRTGRKIP